MFPSVSRLALASLCVDGELPGRLGFKGVAKALPKFLIEVRDLCEKQHVSQRHIGAGTKATIFSLV